MHQESIKHKEQNCQGNPTRMFTAHTKMPNLFCRPSLPMSHLSVVASDFLPDGAKEQTHFDATNCVLHLGEMHEKSGLGHDKMLPTKRDNVYSIIPKHTFPFFWCNKLPIIV